MQTQQQTEPGRGKKHKQERITYWRQVIQEQEQSGQNVSKFCKQNNLNAKKLHGWKYRLRKAGLLTRERAEGATSNATFIPVQLASVEVQSAPVEQLDLEINMDEIQYKCSFNFNSDVLASIIKVFNKLC